MSGSGSGSARESRVSIPGSVRGVLALASLIGLNGLAAAQDQAQQGTAARAQSEGLEEVVVTGSRIARRDYTSQSPIVTVNSDTFQDRSSSAIESALNQLPQFRTSGNQSALSPAQNPFPSATATPGATTLDLRGLGPNRTLVLLDGRRGQPVNATLAVDLNTIPTAAIDSVETITGGAASTYGADAIAGVVNFKLKQHFQGLTFDAQYGISQEKDDQEPQVSGLMGTDFADGKGNVMLALSYAKRTGIQGRDRAWVRAGWDDPGTLAAAPGGNLSQFTPDLPGPFAPGNPPATGWLPATSANYFIDQNGKVFDVNNPLNPAHPYTGPIGGTSGYKINRNGTLGFNNEANDELQIPLQRWSAFGRGHFSFNDHVSAFMEVNFSETTTSFEGGTSGLFSIWAVTIPYNHLYDDPASATFMSGPAGTSYHPVPAQLGALLSSRTNPDAPWTYNGALDYIGGFTELNTSSVYQFTAGFDGDVPGTDWTWEVYGAHGRSNVIQEQPDGYPNLNRIQDLFNANMYGQGWSNPSPLPIGITGHCTSGLPIFNADGSVNNTPSISKDCADWILQRMNTITQLTQQVVEADIQGGLFDMPFSAGKLRYALGADYRSEDFNFNPDSGYNANQEAPVVVQNVALPVAVQGMTDVYEAYAEFSVPVLKDLPGIKSLELDPGYRYSRYNTAGSVSTFKLLGDWAVTDWVKFRGGLEVANRAPNIAELFTPIGGSQLTGISGTITPDPCAVYPGTTPSWGNDASNPNRYNVQALCQYLITRDGGPAAIMVPGASANNYQYTVFGPSPVAFPYSIAITQGNPNLKSETARTVTAGTVLRFPFNVDLLSRMSLSVDWYRIQLDGAIQVPDFNTVYQECLDAQYNKLVGSSPGSVSGAQMAANNPFCALISREYVPGLDPYGADRNYKAQYINTGGIKTSGFDAQFDWNFRISDTGLPVPGSFGMNVIASYLKEYAVAPFAGAAAIDYTGTTVNSSFRYKLFSTFSYSLGPVSGGLRWQHLPYIGPPPGSTNVLGTDSHNQVDLFARWSVTDHLELRAGIDNLLNAWPEWVGVQPGVNNSVGVTGLDYDTIGRRFYLGARLRL